MGSDRALRRMDLRCQRPEATAESQHAACRARRTGGAGNPAESVIQLDVAGAGTDHLKGQFLASAPVYDGQSPSHMLTHQWLVMGASGLEGRPVFRCAGIAERDGRVACQPAPVRALHR